jgi:hypothetical protein
MYGSVLVLLSAIPLIGDTAKPQFNPDGKKSPASRQIEGEAIDLSGYYTCKGQESGGKAYSGIVVMTKRNDVYVVQWVVGGGANFNGIAIRQGTTFAASWSIPNKDGMIVRGINLYRVESTTNGPRLVGRWASLPGPGVQQNETLTFLKKLEDNDE